MKILAISGSPRKGNTHSVLKSIRENFPDLDVKLLQLSDRDMIIREMNEAIRYMDKEDYYYQTDIPFLKKFIANKMVNKITAGFE